MNFRYRNFFFEKKKSCSLNMSIKKNDSAVATPLSEKRRKTQETSKVIGSAGSPVSPVSQSQEVSRSFEKIISQNQKILQKLDMLVSSQKTLEERIIKLEQVPDGNNEELVKVIIKMFEVKKLLKIVK